MTMADTDNRVLRVIRQAQRERLDLAYLLAFYHDLYCVQFQTQAGLPAPQVRDEIARRWRLEGGIPQLTFDQLCLEPASLAHLVYEIIDVLVLHNHPALGSEQGDWTPEQLIQQAQALFATWNTSIAPASNGQAAKLAVSDGLVRLAVGFALEPHLQRAAEAILPHLELSLWKQGYCPVCGGRPCLAMLNGSQSAYQLACSRCASTWPYQRTDCPFCGSSESKSFGSDTNGPYQLRVFPACNHYLKVVDSQKARREVYVPVERLLSVSLDLQARQEGLRS